MRVISSTPVPASFEPELGLPKVTFSGGVANYREEIRISGRYGEIVRVLDGLPTIGQLIAIVLGAFFVTMIWLYPVALISDTSKKNKKGDVDPSDREPS